MPVHLQRRLARATAFLLLVLLPACGEGEKPPRAAEVVRSAREFSALFVVLDACRPEKMSLYGFERPTTPELEALARDPDAVLFWRHYVQAPWTKPSTASLFTGLYVNRHGVFRGTEATRRRGDSRRFRSQVLPAEFDTMAEYFQRRGYATFSVVMASHLIREFGFGQGFETLLGPAETQSDAERVERVLDLVRNSPSRFFGYLHLMGCHYPYPPETRDGEYLRRFPVAYDESARQAAGIDFTTRELEDAIEQGQKTLEDRDAEFLRRVYESELRFVDRRLVGPLVRGLQETGRWDETLLIVTADHGEELWEHGGYGHGHALWEELIHVPLLIKFPVGTRPIVLGREVRQLTSSVDLLPSLLVWLGVPVPAELPGRDILSGVFADHAFAERFGKPRDPMRAVLQGEWKLVTTAAGPLLFDLAPDPGERRDRSTEVPERTNELIRLVRALAPTEGDAPQEDHALSPEVVENLRSLGYLRGD